MDLYLIALPCSGAYRKGNIKCLRKSSRLCIQKRWDLCQKTLSNPAVTGSWEPLMIKARVSTQLLCTAAEEGDKAGNKRNYRLFLSPFLLIDLFITYTHTF